MATPPEDAAGARRFYTDAAVIDGPEGAGLALDGKPLRTPSGAAFVGPRRVIAAAAAEWAAQGETIDPRAMPVTRAVNTAIERVAPQRDAVVDEIAAFAASDLLCHRAEAPAALAERQTAAWDPVLDWLAERHGARLRPSTGVMPASQDPAALAAVRRRIAEESALGLTALYELTTLSGSIALALAVCEARLSAEAAWAASRVDEEWQIAQWGRDAEAERAAAARRRAFEAAERLTRLLRPA